MNKWIFSFCLLLLGPLRAEEKPHDPPLFPIEKNGGDGVSPAKGKIFSDRLRELHEASLMPLANDENAEVYRLILVNYWDTHATVIKLTKKDDGYEVMLACPEEGKPGEATRKLERRVGKLDAGTVEGFQNRLKAASFFTMPTVGKNAGDDGEDWVLEAVRDGKYHVVVRWSPSEDDPSVVPFLATCRWLKEHAPGKDEKNSRFFPQGGKYGISDFEENWYSSHLRALQQKSLISLAADKDAEIYRLTLLPTFNHPLAVILTKKHDEYEINYVEEDGKGGYRAGKLIENRTAKLSPAQAEDFRTVYAGSSFSTLAVADATTGKDGTQWILETVKDGRYHVAVRWCLDSRPENDPAASLFAACNWLLKHAPEKK